MWAEWLQENKVECEKERERELRQHREAEKIKIKSLNPAHDKDSLLLLFSVEKKNDLKK